MTKKIKCILIFVLLCVSIVAVTLLSSCDTSNKAKLSIEFDYTHEVYVGDTLESLRPYLTVKYTDAEGNESVVDEYYLWGSTMNGEREFTVKYLDVKATFNVTVLTFSSTAHTATFVADGVIVEEQVYYKNDVKNIYPPFVPYKEGYDGAWEDYSSSSGDFTVNAVYTPKQYTITFDYNGATSGKEEESRTVTYKQLIGELPVPSKEGYIFRGWYPKLNTWAYEKWCNEEYTKTEDVTLYADWHNVSIPNAELQFELDDDGQSYSVTKLFDTRLDREIVIPSTYNGKPVTAITVDSCKSYLAVTECITIPSSITKIFGGVFSFTMFSNLKTVNYLGSLEEWCAIEFDWGSANPLYNNAALLIDGKAVTQLEIPSSISKINNYAFFGCSSITSIAIPSNVTAIGSRAFDKCNNVDNITVTPDNTAYYVEGNCLIERASKTLLQGYNNSIIPSDIKSIGDYAFYNCKQLKQVTIPDTVTVIGNGAFSECGIKSVLIPHSVSEIGIGAFAGCSDLSDVIISNGVTTVGDAAFRSCYKLVNIRIPASVTKIGREAFMFCTEIESITVDNNNGVYYSEDNCLIEKATQSLILGCKNSIIPENVKEIGEYAFFNQNGLVSIVIPDSVTVIREGAFHQCYNLVSVAMSKNIVAIKMYAFQQCKNLKSIALPATLTEMEGVVFAGCDNLDFIEFAGTVDEWNSMTSYEFWYDHTPVKKVICSDGEAEIVRQFER